MNYKIVQNLSDLPAFTGASRLMFDTETSGFDWHSGDRICGFAIGAFDDPNSNFYIPIRHRKCGGLLDAYKNLSVTNVLSYIKSFTESQEITLVGHHLKFDLNMLRSDGIVTNAKILDTMILAHDRDGDRWSYELDSLTKAFVPGFKHKHYEALEKFFKASQPVVNTDEGKSLLNYSLSPIEILAPYACEDISATRELAKALLAIPDWEPIYNQGNFAWGSKELIANDMELVKVLAEMEWNGVRVDQERCAELRDKAVDEMNQLNDRMFKLAGHSFSPAAWTQLWRAFESAGGRVKYWSAKEKGKQKEQKYTEDKALSTGRPCWNSIAILNYLKSFKDEGNTKAFEFVKCFYFSEQRRRLLSSNLDVYLKKVDSNSRLHGQFHQHRTVTGRLASSQPNLQNICKVKGTFEQKHIEKFLEINDDDALNRQIRSLFVAERGSVIAAIDYSQIEYRGAAYFSEDEVLLGKYRNDPNTDYHTETALVAGIDRDISKTVNFGTLFGMGPHSLSALLGISLEAARAIFEKVFNARPALRQLIRRTTDMARQMGYTQNPFGRRCSIEENFVYKSLNYLVQGTVGDMARNSLVRAFHFIRQNKLPVKMMLTVHDELDSEMPVDLVGDISPKLSKVLCAVQQIPTIPIIADIEVGYDWGKNMLLLKDWEKQNVR